MIKTFKGLIDDNGLIKIRLSTKKGKIGYRIVKFQLFPIDPISNNQESVVKIFKVTQASATDKIDFSDGNLLAAGYLESDNSGSTPTFTEAAIIFDREIFNQDIYITHIEQGADGCNYYLELEVMTLSDNATLISTIRDIRLNPQVGA